MYLLTRLKQKGIKMLSEILNRISNKNYEAASTKFVEARNYWKIFFDKHKNENVDDLALSLEMSLSSFTSIFSNDYLFAKSIMVLTAISYLESEHDFYKNNLQKSLAIKVLNAFKKSRISEEVKYEVDKVAKEYELKL